MTTVFALVKVTDFDVFNVAMPAGVASMPPEMGILDTKYFDLVDGSGVLMVQTLASLEQAEGYKAMIVAPNQDEHQAEIGVKGPVKVWLAEER